MSKVHCCSIILGGLAFVAFTAGLVSGRPQAPRSQDEFVIANVRLFDGEKIVPSASVLVVNGKIEAVGKIVAVPAGAQVIDGAPR